MSTPVQTGPLLDLGKMLADLLDEDQWKSAEEFLLEAEAEREKFAAWVDNECECPCCGEKKTCLSDCTFADDLPDAYERMASAREVLYSA